MKISIIIPVYNEEIYVRECIESLLKQTGFDFEIIVIDDASTDNTAQSVLALMTIAYICTETRLIWV